MSVIKKLPFELFLKSFEYAPRPAVNLLVTRGDGAILLTKRKKPPFAGSWHLPGSFILKGEALLDCAHRVAKEELGIKIHAMVKRVTWLNGLKKEQDMCTLVGVFDDINGDPRGHVVDLVYRCILEKGRTLQGPTFGSWKPVGDTAEMRFFKTMPGNIGFNHKETLAQLGYR